MKRIFVVGCPRSGTTLVQSIIGGYPGFRSFPESGVFSHSIIALRWRKYGHLCGYYILPLYLIGRLLSSVGITWPRLKWYILEFLDVANLEVEKKRFHNISMNRNRLITELIHVLDDHAGFEGWVEKTPNHVFCLDEIEKFIPDAKIIHVVRDAESTIASIYDAALKYEAWKRYEKYANKIDRLIALWSRSTKISNNHIGKTNHLIVNLEELTNNTEKEIKRITDFLDVPYSSDLRNIDASSYIRPDEEWKKNMGKSISPQKSKFTLVFSEAEQGYIRKQLRKLKEHN